ncbi:MAG TPA: RNA polymerase sigma factor [Bordetella sp.]|nr:RNA polymerase sigma factor [Bordetella sp.]
MSVPFYVEIAANERLAIGTGDSGATIAELRHYLEAHYDYLRRRLANDLGCPDLASDCLHDAWLRLGELSLSARVQRPAAYVYRVARNLAVDWLRGEYRTLPLANLDNQIDMPDPLPGPAQTAEARSVLALLDQALKGLPYRHRCVLFDLRVEERTRAQVAETYGLSVRSIDNVLRQTLSHCTTVLQDRDVAAQPPMHAA